METGVYTLWNVPLPDLRKCLTTDLSGCMNGVAMLSSHQRDALLQIDLSLSRFGEYDTLLLQAIEENAKYETEYNRT